MKSKIRLFYVTALLPVMLGTSVLTACGKKESGPELRDCPVIYDQEFGGVYIDKSIEDFNELGFSYGDSVDIVFSNGYEMTDIPYYSGYYSHNSEPLMVAYPGYPHIKACINNGDDLWDLSGMTEDDTATITLNERGKYGDIQDARELNYTDVYSDYGSDEIFANFREVEAGRIAPDTLYRGASPCDDRRGRVSYANGLIEATGVRCILDLADSDENIEGYLADSGFNSPYFQSLYENGRVIPVALNTNFTSDEFRGKLAEGLTAMAEAEGPFYVHCTEGKDRTGFVCMLLEALCGASYDEIEADYMTTYRNYYKLTEESDQSRYHIIVDELLIPMIEGLFDEPVADVTNADLSKVAESYLKSGGMTDKMIDRLRTLLEAD